MTMRRKRGPVETPGQSMRNFTNRVEERARFGQLLDLPVGGHLPVLSFYGVGGAGKTWLLQTLRDHTTACEGVPLAYIDFFVLRSGDRFPIPKLLGDATPYHAKARRPCNPTVAIGLPAPHETATLTA